MEETAMCHYTKQVKSRAGERFIHEAHSFMLVSFYTYLCIYVCLYLQLPLDHINSVALEQIVRSTLAELSKNLMMLLAFFFHWMYKMKFSCYQESSVIHG